MLFNSFPFLILFLPLTLAVSLRLRGNALLRFLSLASFVFYSFAGHAWFVIPMLVTTCLDFFMAPLIAAAQNRHKKRLFLIVSVACNLGLLGYFKYSGLLLRTAEYLTGAPLWSLSALQVILPAGISFYTFQTISYIIDVYRGTAEPERNFWRFACFVSFFPHLVAGPLTRHDQLIPQLSRIAQTGIRPRWEDGIYLFAVGLAKKVLIGDRIAPLIHPLIGDPVHMSMMTAWLALLGFTLQIYFDFSGYSDMAIGLGRLFGIELPQNFNSPYKATSPSDFWRRWHITLSLWLRDYLYITLGGNRCSLIRKNINIMLTMVIGGLWHGANWTFALWGFYHGVLLILYHAFEKPWAKMSPLLQRALTFLLISIGWLFFKANTIEEATAWLARLIDFHSLATPLIDIEYKLAGMVLIGMLITQLFPNASSLPDIGRLRPTRAFALGCLAFASVVMLNYTSRFLYFQF